MDRHTLPAFLLLATLLLPSTAAAGDSRTFALAPDSTEQAWTLHVPQDGLVRFTVSADGAYSSLALTGPGMCHRANLGTSAGASLLTPRESQSVECGIIAVGWYQVTLSIKGGLASGRLEVQGGNLLL